MLAGPIITFLKLKTLNASNESCKRAFSPSLKSFSKRRFTVLKPRFRNALRANGTPGDWNERSLEDPSPLTSVPAWGSMGWPLDALKVPETCMPMGSLATAKLEKLLRISRFEYPYSNLKLAG